MVVRASLTLIALGLCAALSTDRAQAESARDGASGHAVARQRVADPEVLLFMRLVNEYRESVGCPALVLDLRAQSVAQAHSEDMSARRFVGHVNPDGRTHTDRLRLAGVSFSVAAENIAQTKEGAEGVLAQWLASPSHRVNVRNCAFTRHGVGRDGNRWTHVMFRP